MRPLPIILVTLILMAAAPARSRTAWQIGSPDRDSADLALGTSGWREYFTSFPDDALFVVGRSTAAEDWPYVQPGPVDSWAGTRPHTFTILFGIDQRPRESSHLIMDLVDTHDSLPPRLAISINADATEGGFHCEFETPPGGPDASLYGDPASGKPYRIVIAIPPGVLVSGTNEIRITTLTGSWILYDAVSLCLPRGIELAEIAPQSRLLSVHTLPVLRKIDQQFMQPVEATLLHIGAPLPVQLKVANQVIAELTLEDGRQVIETLTPGVEQERIDRVELVTGDRSLAQRQLPRSPVPRWTVGLIHHTHLDIGYTDIQTNVEHRQWSILEEAVDLAEQTRDYPPDSRFKFSPEGLWAIDGYLQSASDEQKERLLAAVRDGWIDLGALYGNELTGLCRPEELIELTGCARRIEHRWGLSIESAMISDVPGYTWGLVPALAACGVHYLSLGPNAGHRIGGTLREWGDRPFYWISPSGTRRILTWMAGRGYGWGHSLPGGVGSFDPARPESNALARSILDQIAELQADDYPYDIVQMRYSIGGDNGPPDPALSAFVRSWNQRFAYPRLSITTTTELFRTFERRYGDKLPVVRGDFTPYWEDGAASSARETAVNRAAAERLVQASMLWAALAPREYPRETFARAWREVILYDEHTWGAWNSISAPDDDFVKQQWRIKQAFALEADRISRELVDQAFDHLSPADETVAAVLVFNTCSWPRTDLVVIEDPRPLAGERVIGPGNQPVPSQRLGSGRLAFLAVEVPALGASRYTLVAGPPAVWSRALVKSNRLSNALLTATIDESTGVIDHLWCAGGTRDLVEDRSADSGRALGLADLLYVAGRNPTRPERPAKTTVRAMERGPLVASLVTEGPAPGCRSLSREIRLIAGLDRLDIILVIDKEEIHQPEAVHIGFPFAISAPVTHLGLAWAVVRPEIDQLAGACKNYYPVQRWVDISTGRSSIGPGSGVTWASPDAPLVELGAIHADPIVVGWLPEATDSATIYSYAMNNYWETNYKAGQQGPVRLRYSIRPHTGFDPAAAERFGIERAQPLLVVPVAPQTSDSPPLMLVHPEDVLITSLRPGPTGDGLVARLFNASGRTREASLSAGVPAAGAPDVWRATPDGTPLEQITLPLRLHPWEIATLLVRTRDPQTRAARIDNQQLPPDGGKSSR